MRIQDRIKQLSKLVNTWNCDGELLAKQVALQLYQDLNTPTSLGLYLALKAGDIDSVVNHEIDPRHYLSHQTFRDDYLAVSYLAKFPFKGREDLTRRKAVEKLLEAEVLCRETNRRFRAYRKDPMIMDPEVHSIFHGMSRKISAVLGNFDMSEWHCRSRFGPGATNMVSGVRATIYDKLGSALSATADCASAALAVVNSTPTWVRSRAELSPFDEGPYVPVEYSDLAIVPGNAITFVPKNAKTDRPIAIEPHLNIYLQLGIGGMIRHRLRSRAGLDLDDQGLNQTLAYRGSKFGGIATIDLSSASDTIATEVVREFLPDSWFYFMDLTRSKVGTSKEPSLPDVIRYEKFSSMGNGFTFELESLIFWALASAVTDYTGGDTSVVRAYGDDIIVPTSSVSLLLKMLGILGFKTNQKKTFLEGSFRESCGKDFFDGYDVRPVFLKERPCNAKQIIRMANGLKRLAYGRNLGFGCDSKLRNAWVLAIRRLPTLVRRELRGPLYREIVVGREGLSNNCDAPLPGPTDSHLQTKRGFLVPVEGCIGSGFSEASVSRFVRISRRERQRGWDGVYFRFARILETAKQFRPRSVPLSYASFLYGQSRGRSSPEITKAQTESSIDGTLRFIPITPFSVPFRGLTTEKVTVRGLSHGWLDDLQWT